MVRAATAAHSEDAEVLENAVNAVLIASRALVGIAGRSLAAIEARITLPQYRALVLLGSRSDRSVGTLADALGIHPSTATRLCDRLVEKGLIVRSTSTESRREVTLGLSTDGRALVRAETRRRRNDIRKIVAQFDEDTRRTLIDAFGAFAEAAGEVPEQAWRVGWTT
jgi:DNA-binding MarR family transcriptional regulator